MKLQWEFVGEDIEFQIEAPSKGWLAIGFNETAALPGTYLLMASVENQVTKAVAYKIIAPGDYRPITTLGGKANLVILEGQEAQQQTTVRIQMPQFVNDGFHKKLIAGSTWTLLLAYSREDDFQHHSMMRTSLPIVF